MLGKPPAPPNSIAANGLGDDEAPPHGLKGDGVASAAGEDDVAEVDEDVVVVALEGLPLLLVDVALLMTRNNVDLSMIP